MTQPTQNQLPDDVKARFKPLFQRMSKADMSLNEPVLYELLAQELQTQREEFFNTIKSFEIDVKEVDRRTQGKVNRKNMPPDVRSRYQSKARKTVNAFNNSLNKIIRKLESLTEEQS